ncbi:MAG: YeeE/YedE family protein [Hyphomonadaceae bacterium]|jgi:uncharacterized membrane protein YedE/YeeE
MEPIPYLVSLAGGLLIGTAAALFLLITGRIAGVSGLVAAATGIAESGPPWWQAAMFVIGMPLGAWLISGFVRPVDINVTSSLPLLIAGGLLVGIGTRLGNGCTSGHGVCGIAGLSPRSLAATATFMAAGFATVYVMRHLVGG